MADNSQDFELWLKSKWDGDPLKAAQADFRKTQKAAQDTEGAMSGMKSTATALKAELMGLLAFAEVVAQFKEGFEQVAALEQAMNQLERAAKRNGDNFEDVKKKFVGFADALKKAAGVDDDAAIRAMTDLYAATGDVENSMNLVKLATDVSIGANMEFTQALSLVTSTAQGKTRALVQLKLAKDEDTASTLTAKEALDRIVKVYGGATEGAKGLKVEVNKLSEAWEDLRNNVVDKVSPALYLLIKAFNTATAYWGALSDLITTTAPNLGAVVMGTMRALWEGVKGNTANAEAEWAHVVAISNTNASKIAIIGEDLKKKLAGIWGGEGDRPDTQRDAPSPTGGPGGAGGADGKDGKKPRELSQLELDQMALSKFRQEMIEKEKKELEKFEAYKKKLKTDGFAYDKRLLSEMDKERDAELDRAIKRTVAEVRAKKAASEAERALANQTADAAMALGDQVFEGNKEWSIASAMISTFRAVAGQLAMEPVGPWNIALAAIMMASGMAQVAKIQNTDPGGQGFDNPSNDRAAYIGGRRWAADMIGEFTSGVSAGWASGMGGGGRSGGNVTYDNRSTMNLHMNVAGFLDPSDTQNMAKFARNLAVVNKTVEGQRRTARTAR